MFHPQGPTFWELARQALSSTVRGYDLLAPKFDYTPFRTPDPILEGVAGQLQALAPFGWGLDVCCGTGAGIGLLRRFCRERVVGLDLSAGMLAEARRQFAEAPEGPPVELVCGDARRLPFGAAFDVVSCFGAFGHILVEEQPAFVRQLAGVLRPGGRFVCVTTYRPPLGSWRYWWRRGFNAAMRVRNRLVAPPFIMYYLTFLLPGMRTLLEEAGFTVEVREGTFTGEWADWCVIIATRRPV